MPDVLSHWNVCWHPNLLRVTDPRPAPNPEKRPGFIIGLTPVLTTRANYGNINS